MNPTTSRFLLLTFAASLACLAGCRDEPQPPRKRPLPVTVGTVSDHGRAVSLRYAGTIEPGTVVPVAFRTGGYVREIAQVTESSGMARFVQAGDRIASGAVLARVEDREYRSRSSQARAGVLEARSALAGAQAQAAAAANTARQARDEYQRAERLFAADSITRFEFDTAKTRSRNADEAHAAARASVDAVRARVQAAEAIVREAEFVSSDTAVRSPLDGFVLSRNIESGSLVGPGTVGFVVAQMDPLKLRFSIPDRLLDKAAVGTGIEGVLDFRPDFRIRGTVTKLALTADSKTRLFDVEVTIPNPDALLKPGMIAQVELTRDDPNRTMQDVGRRRADGAAQANPAGRGLIPLESIVPGPAGETSFAVFQVTASEGTTIAHRREVKLGRPVGNRIVVDSGVVPGDRIVISGAAFLEDGDQVHVIEESR